jgi:hypothetical protein
VAIGDDIVVNELRKFLELKEEISDWVGKVAHLTQPCDTDI